MIIWLSYIIHGVIIAAILYFFYKRDKSALRPYYIGAAVIRLLAGVAFGLTFLYYYGHGDTWRFFEGATHMSDLAFDKSLNDYLQALLFNNASMEFSFHGEPRALFTAKILSIFTLLTANQYWICSLYFSTFAFLGFWSLAATLTGLFPNIKLPVIIALFFYPSVVFWSCGVTKESLAMGALMFVSAGVLNVYYGKKVNALEGIFYLVMLFLLWKIKYYYGGIFLWVVITLLASAWLSARLKLKSGYRYLMFGGLALFILLLVTTLHPNFYLHRLNEVIVTNNQAFMIKSTNSSAINYEYLDGTFIGTIISLPEALFSGLFRPLPGDGSGWFNLCSVLENCLLLVLCGIAIYCCPGPLTFQNQLMIISAILYIAVLATFLALSAPNFGTLVRYKIGFSPFLLLLILINNPVVTFIKKWLFGS